MKTKLFMGKILTVGLTLCMAASLLPLSAFATTEATETADFTAADGGAAALALLCRRNGRAGGHAARQIPAHSV